MGNNSVNYYDGLMALQLDTLSYDGDDLGQVIFKLNKAQQSYMSRFKNKVKEQW